MNVRDWPANRIMQLRDECFGRRWPIGKSVELADGNAVFAISDMALPENTVVWQFDGRAGPAFATIVMIEVRIGDVLPTTDAQFRGYEPLFVGVEGPGIVHSQFVVGSFVSRPVKNMRMIVHTAGRRFVFRFQRQEGIALAASAVLVVSSIPTEVPDCLLSV